MGSCRGSAAPTSWRAFALFDDEPEANQHDSRRARQGDGRRCEGRRRTMVRADQSHVDRQPAGGETHGAREVAMTGLRSARRRWLCHPSRCRCGRPGECAPARPAVGPERPFVPPPRVERTLANGLRVVAVRYATVPKVSVVLTIESGLAVDPAEKAGLAQFVADAVQEGHDDARQRARSGRRSSRWARLWRPSPVRTRHPSRCVAWPIRCRR